MNRIDFHTNVADKLAYACRLTRKAYAAGNKIVLRAGDAAQSAQLDAALWTLAATDFLPHVVAGDALAPHTPIIITCGDEQALPPGQGDILVNLGVDMPAHAARYARVFEIVAADEDDAAAGRKRYSAYKKLCAQAPFQLTHFVAGQQ